MLLQLGRVILTCFLVSFVCFCESFLYTKCQEEVELHLYMFKRLCQAIFDSNLHQTNHRGTQVEMIVIMQNAHDLQKVRFESCMILSRSATTSTEDRIKYLETMLQQLLEQNLTNQKVDFLPPRVTVHTDCIPEFTSGNPSYHSDNVHKKIAQQLGSK